MRFRREALALRDLISSWVRICNGVRAPGSTMRFPGRRECAVPNFCYGVGPAAGLVVGPSGGGRRFPVYCVPCLGSPLWYAARVAPPSGVSGMLVAGSFLWGIYGRCHTWAVVWAGVSRRGRGDVLIKTAELPECRWCARNEPG